MNRRVALGVIALLAVVGVGWWAAARSQLVYRLRIRVTDPTGGLRQGQPVTILLPKAAQ